MGISWNIRQYAVTTSTNDDVRREAENGANEGLVICAGRQTAGKGRHGRSWVSPEGNLYCSILLRPSFPQYIPNQFCFIASLAVFDTIKSFLPNADVLLKWPNDVILEGKKVSGILLEVGENWLVIGIGLNIQHHPDNAVYPSTSLLEMGMDELTVEAVLDTLLVNFSRWYEGFKKDGLEPLHEAWTERAMHGQISVRLPEETLYGQFIGLGHDGSLQLRLADGTERSISTGDVFPALRA